MFPRENKEANTDHVKTHQTLKSRRWSTYSPAMEVYLAVNGTELSGFMSEESMHQGDPLGVCRLLRRYPPRGLHFALRTLSSRSVEVRRGSPWTMVAP